MTITATNGQLVFREFAGFDDPGLPAGYWVALVSVTGDASGGVRTLPVTFNLLGAPLDSRFYSVEQIAIFDAQASAGVHMFTFAGFDQIGTGTKLTTFQTGDLAGPLNTAALVRDIRPKAFLGQQGNIGTATVLTVDVPNADGIVVQAQAEGYFWTARSVNVDGGLRRPLGGLYPF